MRNKKANTVAVICLLLAGCGVSKDVFIADDASVQLRSSVDQVRHPEWMELSDDADEMKKRVLELVPIGTPAETAKELMEEKGYQCEFWVGSPDFPTIPPVPSATLVTASPGGMGLLRCTTKRPARFALLVSVQADFYYDSTARVTAVQVKAGRVENERTD